MNDPNDELLVEMVKMMQIMDKIMKIKSKLREDIIEKFIPVNKALIDFSHYMSHYCDKAPANEE